MPVMDGYTAAREIRKWEEKLKAQSSKPKAEDRGQRIDVRVRMSEVRSHKTEVGGQASNLQHPTFNIPIIAMTAHAMAGDEEKSIEAGMNDHVTKPIDPDQLFATLQKWIQPGKRRSEIRLPEGAIKSPEADQSAPDKDQLPESLPGFDLVAGLSRLRGNKGLYRKLLLDFGANYGGVVGEIRKALKAKNFKLAHSLVHNLKGLSGNLEATDLLAAAVEMEKLVKGDLTETPDNKELDQKFIELEKATNQALDAVQTLGLLAGEDIFKPSIDWLAEVPLEQIKAVADRIKAAAEMGDVMNLKSIADELKSESDASAPFCKELARLAGDFDFEGIQKIMLELSS